MDPTKKKADKTGFNPYASSQRGLKQLHTSLFSSGVMGSSSSAPMSQSRSAKFIPKATTRRKNAHRVAMDRRHVSVRRARSRERKPTKYIQSSTFTAGGSMPSELQVPIQLKREEFSSHEALAVGLHPTTLPFVSPLDRAGPQKLRLMAENSQYDLSATDAIPRPAPLQACQLLPPHGDAAAELLKDRDGRFSEEDRLLFVQMPATLPFIPRRAPKPKPKPKAPVKQQKTVAGKKAAGKKEETPPLPQQAPNPNPLSKFPSGHLGKLRVHRSGRMTLVLNDSVQLEVFPGVQASFVQEVMSVDMEKGECHSLGQVVKKAVASVDIASMTLQN
eukprot:gnl/Dysnectes_brevis/1532_a1740_1472.p1 GENE.gnl/Dysnectes_brevis/1532_a1740_1472~~gnl/Dysnectes_brevis/1532_a1740_1472.p1  ORF type:complete len:351 (-),score=95.87 gnl/Dysnectes_brevis/1532_a1740_1472:56-1051(-)